MILVAALLLLRIPLVLASFLKYMQTGEGIIAAFTALVLAGYTLFRFSESQAALRANAASAAAAAAEMHAAAAAEAAEKHAAAAAAAAKEVYALLVDTNRKTEGFSLWRTSSNDGMLRLFSALPPPSRARCRCLQSCTTRPPWCEL